MDKNNENLDLKDQENEKNVSTYDVEMRKLDIKERKEEECKKFKEENKYKIISLILGIVTMAWMYLTPVMYSVDLVPEQLLPIFNLNPMTPIIIVYRDILYYKTIPQISTLLHAFILGLLMLLIGSAVFSKLQRNFVEEL